MTYCKSVQTPVALVHTVVSSTIYLHAYSVAVVYHVVLWSQHVASYMLHMSIIEQIRESTQLHTQSIAATLCTSCVTNMYTYVYMCADYSGWWNTSRLISYTQGAVVFIQRFICMTQLMNNVCSTIMLCCCILSLIYSCCILYTKCVYTKLKLFLTTLYCHLANTDFRLYANQPISQR